MSGLVVGVAVVSTAVAVDQQNKATARADQIAADTNANNLEANNRSIAQADKVAASRKAELLRRFNIKNSKLQDTSKVINIATSHKLTNAEMSLTAARSATDNNLATKHITGRLAERLRNAQDIKGSMVKDSIVQAGEAQLEAIGDKAEAQAMDFETETANLDIDLSNSITAANNQMISNYAYSNASGSALAAGLGGAASGVALGSNIKSAINNP